MQIEGPNNPTPAELRPVFRVHAQLYKALANEHRLAVIYALRDGEKRVSDLATELGISIHNLSQHLAILRRERVVCSRKEGQCVFYRITDPKFIQASALSRQALIEQHGSDGQTLLTADRTDVLRAVSGPDDSGQASAVLGEGEEAGGHSRLRLISDSEVPASSPPFGDGDGLSERSPCMDERVMSRRKFLVGTGVVVGAAAGLTGLAWADKPTVARAAGTAIPWAYPTDPADQPDPVKMAGRAYEIFYNSGCAEGCWFPVIEFLAAADPSSPWATLPADIFAYAAGGVRSWGSLCGALNGAAAIIGMVAGDAAAKITDEVFAWYGKTPIPSNLAERAVDAGTWTPAAGIPAPMANMPTSTAHSQLCHSSLSQWTMTSGFELGSAEHYDRCGKLTFDVEHKTIALLNDYFANGMVPAGTLDPTVATCGACHSTVALGKQACDSCHDETPTHSLQ